MNTIEYKSDGVYINGTRIDTYPTTLPASDVYAWAKASTKPAYTYSEVGAAATSHSHAESDITNLVTDLNKKATLPIANVLDYGAVANNSTDCRTAFANALASGAGVVFVPSGTYYLSDYITIPTEVMLLGEGVMEKANLHFANGKVGIKCPNQYGTVKNIAVWYAEANSDVASIGILITAPHVTIDHCIIKWAFVGIEETHDGWLCVFDSVNTLYCGCGFLIGDKSGSTNTNLFKNCFANMSGYSNDSYASSFSGDSGCGFEFVYGRANLSGCAADKSRVAGLYAHYSAYVTCDIFTGDNYGSGVTCKTNIDGGAYAIIDAQVLMGNGYAQTLGSGVNSKIIMREQQCGASVYRGSAWNIPDSTETVIPFDTEVYDTDSSFDTSNSRFTPDRQAGLYLVTINVLASVNSTHIVQLRLRKNATAFARSEFSGDNWGNASSSISMVCYLNGSTDYVDATIYQNMGAVAALNTDSAMTNMTITYIGNGLQDITST